MHYIGFSGLPIVLPRKQLGLLLVLNVENGGEKLNTYIKVNSSRLSHGFAPIIALVAFSILVVVATIVYRVFPIQQKPQGPSSTVVAKDERDCIGGETKGELHKEFLTNKRYGNYALSGERGTFNADGTVAVEIHRDYVPNDTRPGTKVGAWSIENGQLTISKTGITDGTYTDFRFYTFEGDTIAVPKDTSLGMFIGSDDKKLDKFEEMFFKCLSHQT